MPTIEVLTDRAEAIAPDTPGSEVFARFAREPDTLVIAVVEDGRPVGLIERNDFLLRIAGAFGYAAYANRTAVHVMDAEPAVVEAGVEIDAFSDALLRGGAAALMRGFIVTRNGRYHGVGTAVSLLKAVADEQRRRNLELTDEARQLADARTREQAAARSRADFLNVLGHELRTPMNGVMAVADLLRRQPLNPQAQAHVATIMESSETLLRTLQDALDLTRAEAGELDLSLAPAPLRAVMDDIQADWAPHAARDNVALMVGYEGDTELAAVIDAARLRQVFDNLIGNALKVARNGVVEAGLKAVASGDTVRLEARVRDDGPGIEDGGAERIFEPFVHDGGAGRAGLGLSICRHIVERMGGRIRAEQNQGRGATFAFVIDAPRAEPEAAAESNVETLPDFDLHETPHVLIVDDNATNRVVAQALCEMFGCTSETAEDGVEAVECVKERRFDLVLMDIKMPRMDGVQATQAIRALPGPENAIPIVALTANADPDDARRYLEIGMVAVVEKPIKPERLRMAMNAALEQTAAAPAAVQDRSVA